MLPLEIILTEAPSKWPSTCPQPVEDNRYIRNIRYSWTFNHRNEHSGKLFRVTLCAMMGAREAYKFSSVHLAF